MTDQQHSLVRQVARDLKKHCRCAEGDRLLLAVSGGVDSVALLRALAELAPKRGWRLQISVGHVLHDMRSDGSAEEDARFVQTLAAQLGLEYVQSKAAIRDLPGNIEANARRARYEQLQTLAEQQNCRAVVTAHQADDQMETMLMRLLRGSSPTNLKGMAWRRRLSRASSIQLWRPMLAVSRAQVVSYLDSYGQNWREDQTNQDTSRQRAHLRQTVLPVLKQMQPKLQDRFLQMSHKMRQIEVWQKREVDKAWPDLVIHQGDYSIKLSRDALRQLPPYLAGLCLKKALTGIFQISKQTQCDEIKHRHITSRHIDHLLKLACDSSGSQRKLNLPQGLVVDLTKSTFIISKISNPGLDR